MLYRFTDFVGRHVRSIAASSIGFSTIGYFILNTPDVRAMRLKSKFNKPISDFQLNELPYIPNERLVADLKFDCVDTVRETAGVRIVWTAPGAGKTTAIKRTLNDLLESKQISGIVYISPSIETAGSTPAEWFRNSFKDVFGNLLLPHEKLSSLLGYSGDRPMVIVLDQIEDNFLIDEKFERLVRVLAYDSEDCKSYIVLLATSNPDKALEAYQWNGGTKISFLGTHLPWEYRWTELEINKWLDEYVTGLEKDEKNKELIELFSKGSSIRDLIVSDAVKAGTPSFLLRSVQVAKNKYGSKVPLDPDPLSIAWESGKKLIQSVLYANQNNKQTPKNN